MEFEKEEFIDREIEIAHLLIQNYPLKKIRTETGLSRKLLTAHIKNMMQKLKTNQLQSLIRLLKTKFDHQ